MHLKNPKQRVDDGRTCNGGEDCAREIYSCLSFGDSGTMTGGGCDRGSGYCVTCVQE